MHWRKLDNSQIPNCRQTGIPGSVRETANDVFSKGCQHELEKLSFLL